MRKLNQVKQKEPNIPQRSEAPLYDGNLFQALTYLQFSLGLSSDFTMREIEIIGKKAMILFYSTICDQDKVQAMITAIHNHQYQQAASQDLEHYLVTRVLTAPSTSHVTNMMDIRQAVASGNIVLLIDQIPKAITVFARDVAQRSPDEPPMEASSRSAQIGFVENVFTNIGLLRLYMSNDSLLVKQFTVGVRSNTPVMVAYMKDVAQDAVVQEIIEKIELIEMDYVDSAAAIEQRVCAHQWNLFPLARITFRVDNVVRELNQGKVSIHVDGDPTAILLPSTIQDFFQTEEDYTHTAWEASFIRILRVVAMMLSIYLPALYVALVDFNPELLPKLLGFHISSSRAGVPFSAVMEVVIMQFIIEILREASLRIPKQMGQTIGVVGGLVVGQAAVEAGIVSNILIIIVALTAISVFVAPSYEFTIVTRMLAWVMLFASAFMGIYGVILFSIWMLYEVGALRLFGVAYMEPYNGAFLKDAWIDGLLRLPLKVAPRRTAHMRPEDPMGEIHPPKPNKKGQQK